MVDYTPALAVSAGEVVVIGSLPLVAHLDIPANTLGAVAAAGGVYKMTAGGAISAGAKVYWDASNSKVVASGVSGAKHFGFCAPNSSATEDGDTVEVIHAPDGTALS